MANSTSGVDDLIKDLDRIPKTINTKIIVKDILNEINTELKKQTKRYNSYGKRG